MNNHLSEKTQSELDRLLVKACLNQEYRKIPELLDAGANPNAADEEDGWSPLSALVDNSAQYDEQNDRDFIPDGFWKAIELFLEKGADINQIITVSHGWVFTAMMHTRYTLSEVAQFLLEHGADPDVVNAEDSTILDDIELDQFSYYTGEWENDSDYWGRYSQIRKILLDHGTHRAKTLSKMAEFEKWDKLKQKIYHACWHMEAAKLDEILIENPITLPDERFDRLFYEAVKIAPEFMQKHFIDDPDGYEDRLIALLDIFRKHGIDLNADEGNALYYSVLCGYVKTARYLLAHGADPDKCDCGGWEESVDHPNRQIHYYTLAEVVLHWRCYWKKETALAFQEMFPVVKK